MTSNDNHQTSGGNITAASRKDAHIDLALDPQTRSGGSNGFDRMGFEHCAMPEMALPDIDLSTAFFGQAA
jgi:isopentenyl-diphosphate delta-isomerase